MSRLTLVLAGLLFLGCGDPDHPPPHPAVADGGPSSSAAAVGKLCHDLAEVSGVHITLKLEIGSTTLSATTLSCGACQPLPTGSTPFRIYWPGASTPDNTLFEDTVDIDPGEDWLFAVTKKDDTFEMMAGPLKDQYTCQSFDPFAP